MKTGDCAVYCRALGVLLLVSCLTPNSLGKSPDWHQDIECLTWDRALEADTGLYDHQVFLQPEAEYLDVEGAPSLAQAWRSRIKNLFSSTVPQSLQRIFMRRNSSETTFAAPNDAKVALDSRGTVAR